MARPAAALLLVLALVAGPLAARAATDCVGALIKANMVCGAELAAVRDGGVPEAVSAKCCAEAANVFSASFGADCACEATLSPYRDLLDRAQAAVAAKCASSDIRELPACGSPVARTAAAAAAEADAPLWGTNSICTAQTGCRTKCTPRRRNGQPNLNPTQSQINTAKRCSATQGTCAGLDSSPTGTTFCGRDSSISVPDPDVRNGVTRQCWQCCTARLAPTGTSAQGRNACRDPARNNGGGGGGGGGCFPGSSTVVVEGRGATPLRDVKIGDRVLSVKAGGKAASFETVYFFGHQLEKASAEFVRLEVDGGATFLELTRKHLIPVLSAEASSASLESAVYVRAVDVQAGDRLILADGDGSNNAVRLGEVTSSSAVTRADGLFAPLTTGGGHVVVNNVLASVHSNNLLEPLGELLDRRDLLHWAYETFGAAPLKTIYSLVGADNMRKISPVLSGWGLGDAAQLVAGVRGLGARATASKSA